jgi:hypothetical protein
MAIVRRFAPSAYVLQSPLTAISIDDLTGLRSDLPPTELDDGHERGSAPSTTPRPSERDEPPPDNGTPSADS